MMWRFFLIILAVLIVLALAGYALSLVLKLRKQNKYFAQVQNARYRSILESVELIARAMQSGQCNLSEGVLRLKPLLDVLGHKLSTYSAMWALYQVVENMPILDERKNLKRNERMKLDLERELKEAELEQEIQKELEQLLKDAEQLKHNLK